MTSDCFYLNHLKSLKADWNPSCSVVMAFHNATCFPYADCIFICLYCPLGRLQFWAFMISFWCSLTVHTAGPNAWDLSRLSSQKGWWVWAHSARHKYRSNRSMFEMFMPLGYFSPCEAIVRAAFSIKFEAGLPWDSLVRLYFADLCSLYMIGTTIHSYVFVFVCILHYLVHPIYMVHDWYHYTFLFTFLYTFYTLFVCPLSFRLHRRSKLGRWQLLPRRVVALAQGSRPRCRHHNSSGRRWWSTQIFPSQVTANSLLENRGAWMHMNRFI